MTTAMPVAASDGPVDAAAPVHTASGDSSSPRKEVTELLGVLAYMQLSGFTRLVAEAEAVPRLTTKLALSRLAIGQFEQFESLTHELEARGIDAEDAMSPFVAPVDEYHARTHPGDWVEGLAKAYVGDGVSADFYASVMPLVDPSVRDLAETALRPHDEHVELLLSTLCEELERDPSHKGRLSLYVRRLAGEALSQAQRISGMFPEMAHVLHLPDGESELAAFGQLLVKLTERHSERMRALGLTV